MSVNNSSCLSNSSFDSALFNCYDSTVSILITVAFYVTRAFLLLPLSILVLYLGYQRWWPQRSFTTTSHCDIFTYHVAALELIWCFGAAIFYCGYSTGLPEMMTVGYWFETLSYSGESFFNVLTCVERYLAVVHPITYLGLKNARGARIRNISIGCGWLLCFGTSSAMTVDRTRTSFFFILAFTFVVVSFCSLCALCVLIRPGPGEGGRDRERVDQSKQRAFHTIIAITVVLWSWFLGIIVSYALSVSPLLSRSLGCVIQSCGYWLNLPYSLILPLMYLHRAGKLSFCCYKSG